MTAYESRTLVVRALIRKACTFDMELCILGVPGACIRAAVLIARTGTLPDGFVQIEEYATPVWPVKKPLHSSKAQVEEENF